MEPFPDPFPTGPTPTALFITPKLDEPQCERDESSQDLKVDIRGIPETCVVWVDEFEDETGFLVVLKYWSGGEIFVYEVGPDATQLIVPHEHAPRLDESQEQFMRRHDFEVIVTALRPGGKTWPVGSTALVVDNPDLRKLPTATPTQAFTATQPQPIVQTMQTPIPLEPLVTGPMIFFAGWAPDGETFAYQVFNQEQTDELAMIPEGPIGYPPASLHFYQVSGGEPCQYPRPVDVVTGSPTWLPDGSVLIRVSQTWLVGTPCRNDFTTAGPDLLQAHLPDPGLSPQGDYRASTEYDCREGLVYYTTTITDTSTSQRVNALKWMDEERIGSCWNTGPGGQWVSYTQFLIPFSLDQGPLLIEAGGKVVQVASELFNQPVAACLEEACQTYYAFTSPWHPNIGVHLILRVGDRYQNPRDYLLYHPDEDEVEDLPLVSIWNPGFSRDGRWLLMGENPDHRSDLWIRPVDPAGGEFRLFTSGIDELFWSSDGRRLAIRGWNHNLYAYTFPEGTPLGAWDPAPDYVGVYWSPDNNYLVTVGSQDGQEYNLAIVQIN